MLYAFLDSLLFRILGSARHNVYMSFVSCWPVQKGADLLDGPILYTSLQKQYICFVCRRTSDSSPSAWPKRDKLSTASCDLLDMNWELLSELNGMSFWDVIPVFWSTWSRIPPLVPVYQTTRRHRVTQHWSIQRSVNLKSQIVQSYLCGNVLLPHRGLARFFLAPGASYQQWLRNLKKKRDKLLNFLLFGF